MEDILYFLLATSNPKSYDKKQPKPVPNPIHSVERPNVEAKVEKRVVRKKQLPTLQTALGNVSIIELQNV